MEFTLKWDDAKPERKVLQITSNFGELLYVGYHHRKLIHRSSKLMIAFTLDVDDAGDESDGDGLAGQCYSLEMTADFDWEFDRILFAVPQAVYKITQESEVCNTGLVAGGHNVQDPEEVRSVSEQGGKWVWIEYGQAGLMDLVDSALHYGLSIVLGVSNPFVQEDVETKIKLSVAAIVLSLADQEPSQIRASIHALRTTWNRNATDLRILVRVDAFSSHDVINFIEQTTADGLYFSRVELSQVIPLLNTIGLHSYASVPIKVNDHYVLVGSHDV